MHLEAQPIEPESLDPRYVFVLDTGIKIFMWYGKKSKSTLKSKSRLMAEKINKNERKNKAEILTEIQGDESSEFWDVLNLEDRPYTPIVRIFLIYLHSFIFHLIMLYSGTCT